MKVFIFYLKKKWERRLHFSLKIFYYFRYFSMIFPLSSREKVWWFCFFLWSIMCLFVSLWTQIKCCLFSGKIKSVCRCTLFMQWPNVPRQVARLHLSLSIIIGNRAHTSSFSSLTAFFVGLIIREYSVIHH